VEHRHPSPKRVAVIDEDVWSLRAIGDLLRDVGFETLGVSAPDRAIELLAREPFDVVVAGAGLGPGSSERIAACLHARESRPGMVLMSNRPSPASAPGALFDATVDRPRDAAALLTAVEVALAAARTRVHRS
jgi:DNA-binding NtrC family response regulator